MTLPTPVLRFLPDADLSTGPFGLLGLPAGPVEPGEVEPALMRQLARLARHPLGRTTEADEVRLALHVAAAQLRDPRVQEELLLDLSTLHRPRPASPQPARAPAPPPSPVPPPPPPQAPTAPSPAPALAMPTAFEQAAIAVIVYSGGWNREAQRRIASLAHVFNADADTLRRALTRVARRPAIGRAAGAAGAPTPDAAPVALPTSRRWRWIAPIILIVTALGSVAMVGVLWSVTRRPAFETPAQSAAAVLPSDSESVPPAPLEPATESPASPRTERPDTRAPAPQPLSADPEPAPISDAVARWAALAHTALDSAPSDTPLDSLRSAERLARVNLAATRLLAGDTSQLEAPARQGLSFEGAIDLSAPEIEDPLRAMTAHAVPPDGEIAELILLARRSPGQNITAINRMIAPTHPLGPADCDALATAAFIGSPAEIRTIARRFIEPQLSNPFMIHALLEALPSAPARDEVSALLESASLRRLPRPTRSEWRLEARRALLARLAETLAAGDSETDTVAESLLSAWRQASASQTPPTDQGVLNAGALSELDAGSTAAAALYEHLLARAALAAISQESRDELDAIARRRAVERPLAHGVIQRAAVDQRACAELLAFIVARERPAVAPQVERILAGAAASRARATHAFQQIEDTERATTALWFLRLGLDAPEEAP